MAYSDMKIGVVGTGSAGRRHARNLVNIGIGEVILCSENRKGGDYLEELQSLPLVDNFEMLIEHATTAIVIANNTNLHAVYAEKALQAGRAVYLEKPAGMCAEEVARLITIQKRNQNTVAIGCQHRFNPLLEKVQENIRQSRFGQLLNISCTMGEYMPNYHPGEDYRRSYTSIDALGGGVLRTQIHDINYLHWLFGELTVLSAVGGKVSDLEIDVEDSVTALMKTTDAVPVSLHMDYLQKVPFRCLEVFGTDGGMRWDYYENQLMIWRNDGCREVMGRKSDFDRNTLFDRCMRDFLNCIETNQKPRTDLMAGYLDLHVVDQIRQHLVS